jgi:hypothetical protein
MAMLHHVKYRLFILLSICLIVNACKKEQENRLSAQSRKLSEVNIGSMQYNAIYQNAIDSIHSWVSNKVSVWKDEELGKSIVLDSLFCFNSKKDKLITALLAKTLDSNYTVDGVHFFYGVKIKEQWYFFMGPHVVLPRESYQKDIHTPLSFEKLHEIAMENVFRGYLKKKDKGGDGETEWEINEAFFQGMAPKNQAASGYGSCFECKMEEEYYLYLVRKNWESRDATNYE